MSKITMMRYSEFVDRLDVDAFEEAIGFEVLDTAKSEDRGYCPDPWKLHKHGDTTGKFAIHREKRVFNCFLCGGGTLLSLAMVLRNIGEQEATDWLYQFTAPPRESGEDFLRDIDELLADHHKREATLPYFNERVLDRFDGGMVPAFFAFLADRGINRQIADDYRVGFCSKHQRRSSKGIYHGPAVIFPHFWQGRLVGWQERWLDDERPPWVNKYTNTNDFPKSTTVYGYERTYFATRPIVVCESVPTVLHVVSGGFPAVATFGSSVNTEQMRLLRGCQQGLILAPDNDKAGEKWTLALYENLADFVPLRVLEPLGEANSGADLGDVSLADLDAVLASATNT